MHAVDTLKSCEGVSAEAACELLHKPLPRDVDATIVGHADDGDSLEAMVVRIDGCTDRPDGSVFHITWSLDKSKGRKPRESNDLLKERGWHRLDHPVPISLDPARF